MEKTLKSVECQRRGHIYQEDDRMKCLPSKKRSLVSGEVIQVMTQQAETQRTMLFKIQVE